MPSTLLSLSTPGRKPSPPLAQLNGAHPFARGLLQLWLLNEGGGSPRGLVGTRPAATFANGAAWMADRRGPAINLAGGTNWLVLLGTDTALGFPSGPITIFYGYRKVDGTPRASVAFAADTNGSTERMLTHLPYSDGTVYWDYGGFSEGSTRLSVGSLTFGDDVWAFTVGARGMEIWQNGLLRASNGANPTRTLAGTNIHLGAAPTMGITADAAAAWYFAVYNYQLPAALIAQISRDPYAHVQPPLFPTLVHDSAVAAAPPQLAAPVADVSAGGWTASTGSDLYAMLDETVADDSDYDQSATTPSSDVMEVQLTSLTDPTSSTGHVVRFRAWKPS